jgi:glycosyltransferase involved in cell wall biosynthesis
MRICLCTAYFPPIIGGAENQAARLASGLARLGDEVSVVTRQIPGLPTREIRQGVRVYRVIRPGQRGALFGLGYCLSLLAFFLRPGRRFDVVQATSVHLGAYIACRLRRRLGYRVVVRPTGLGPDGDLASLARMPFWPLWRGGDVPTRQHVLSTIQRADAFVALNREIVAELVMHGFPARRILRIANGVPLVASLRDAEERRAERSRLGLGEGPVLLFVGRLNRHKGAGDVIGVLPSLAQRFPRPTLVLLGDGPLREELAALAESLGVSQEVRLLGESDPTPFLRVADVFVLPTQGEGMSNALLEAMGAGLPCVATRVPGNVDVISHGQTGLLVEPGKPEELAGAIGRLLADPALRLRMGEVARHRVRDIYSVDAMVAAYRCLFDRLIAGRDPLEGDPGAARA